MHSMATIQNLCIRRKIPRGSHRPEINRAVAELADSSVNNRCSRLGECCVILGVRWI